MNNTGNPLDTPFEKSPHSIPPSSTKSDHPLSPSGRFTRLSFLAWSLILAFSFSCVFALLFLLGITGFALTGATDPALFFSHPMTIIAIILALLSYIGCIASIVIVFIRRLHDLNKSGWLVLLTFIPFVGIIFSIYVCVARGSTTTNNYGAFRPTEQAEKFLGYLYLAFLSLFLVVYLMLFAAIISKPTLFEQISGLAGTGLTESSEYAYDDHNLEAPSADREPVTTHSEEARSQQINRDTAHIEAAEESPSIATQAEVATQNAETSVEQIQQDVDDAVRQAQEAAEAAVNSASNQQ